jgi:hypothetical protein
MPFTTQALDARCYPRLDKMFGLVIRTTSIRVLLYARVRDLLLSSLSFPDRPALRLIPGTFRPRCV